MENTRIRQLQLRRSGLKQKLWEEYFLFKHRRTTILRAGPTWYGGKLHFDVIYSTYTPPPHYKKEKKTKVV